MTNPTPPDPRDPQPSAPSASPARTPRAGAVTSITVSALIIGALALAATGGNAAIAATGQFTGVDGPVAQGTSLDVTGVTKLTLDAGGGSVTIRYADVPEATLRSTGRGSGNWTMHREGGTLVVESPRAVLGWWVDGWFQDGPSTTLTLPDDLSGRLDADLTLEAGALDAQGDFGTLKAKLSAGMMTLDGSARDVTARVDAGAATLHLSDVATADLTMSAGRLDATLTGSQPDSVKLDVSAGAMDVTVPSGSYALSKDVSAGSLDARIPTDSSSDHRVQVDLSAGSISLRSGS
ncbi:hypothetical protein [Microbacterium capsulatum]|uniref:Adhesin domain-containing protein n=1 Tax=Microbacterium capsulatum TaxID=3041921 RepID=A0ABU0XI33_9MICO|nr:hypothetical protein [Microbacterium sp. ASV81]MDQ4214797.1 hypothetical protein [Microbacterium sp. ASV81]